MKSHKIEIFVPVFSLFRTVLGVAIRRSVAVLRFQRSRNRERLGAVVVVPRLQPMTEEKICARTVRVSYFAPCQERGIVFVANHRSCEPFFGAAHLALKAARQKCSKLDNFPRTTEQLIKKPVTMDARWSTKK
eukprot:Selendium_serpulae@DN3567_c0_g1_i2.p1